MNFIDDLKLKLEESAPNWIWICKPETSASPDLISPTRIEILGKNKTTGFKTVPIQVCGYPNSSSSGTAEFVCQILMIDSLEPKAPETLLLHS